MTYQIIRVTDKHIREGRLQSLAFYRSPLAVESPCKTCPIAQAIHEQTRYVNAMVDTDGIFTNGGNTAHFPRSVARFIRRFDRGEKVKPFNFKLTWK
jgi:hypothetical protein